jgi:predicted DNA-binding protein
MVREAVPETDPREPYSRIVLNFPPDLAERLRELAKRERRPLTAQVQVLVERALAESELIPV